MIAELTQGSVFKFRYNGKPRIALAIEPVGHNHPVTRCWDFTNDGFRCFDEYDIDGEIEDVSGLCRVIPLADVSDAQYMRWLEDPSVHTKELNDKLYIVRF